MTIISENFRRIYTGPKKAGRFQWRFEARVNPDTQSYYELNFLETRRTFHGTKIERFMGRSTCSRALSQRDVDKLRSLLPDEEIVACTLAAFEAGR